MERARPKPRGPAGTSKGPSRPAASGQRQQQNEEFEEIETLCHENGRLSRENRELGERLEEADRSLKELLGSRQEVSRLNDENQELQMRLAASSASGSGGDPAARGPPDEVETLRQENALLATNVEELRARLREVDSSLGEMETLRRENVQLRQENRGLLEEAGRSLEEVAALRREGSHVNNRNVELQAQVDEANGSLEALFKEVATLRRSLGEKLPATQWQRAKGARAPQAAIPQRNRHSGSLEAWKEEDEEACGDAPPDAADNAAAVQGEAKEEEEPEGSTATGHGSSGAGSHSPHSTPERHQGESSGTWEVWEHQGAASHPKGPLARPVAAPLPPVYHHAVFSAPASSLDSTRDSTTWEGSLSTRATVLDSSGWSSPVVQPATAAHERVTIRSSPSPSPAASPAHPGFQRCSAVPVVSGGSFTMPAQIAGGVAGGSVVAPIIQHKPIRTISLSSLPGPVQVRLEEICGSVQPCSSAPPGLVGGTVPIRMVSATSLPGPVKSWLSAIWPSAQRCA